MFRHGLTTQTFLGCKGTNKYPNYLIIRNYKSLYAP